MFDIITELKCQQELYNSKITVIEENFNMLKKVAEQNETILNIYNSSGLNDSLITQHL